MAAACAARCAVALRLVDRAERVLIGVERDLGVDHEALPAGHADDDVGPQAPALAVRDADLGREIAMFGQAAAFEHVAQLLLAPAAARLGRVAQRVDQLGGLGRHALGAGAHRFDLARQQAEGVAALRLDLLDRRLVALEAFVDRLEQRLQIAGPHSLPTGGNAGRRAQECFLRVGRAACCRFRRTARDSASLASISSAIRASKPAPARPAPLRAPQVLSRPRD